MKKVKIIACITALLLLITVVGCDSSSDSVEESIPAEFSIVCTLFSQYDWIREVLGERLSYFDVSYLADRGVDSHSFAPSVQDIGKIKSADLFVYTGGKSDNWVEGIARNPDSLTLNLIEALGDDVLIFGDFCGDDCDEDHDHNQEEEQEAVGVDEHICVSLRHAKIAVAAIADSISELDPDNAQIYSKNATRYIAELSDLDERYQAVVKESAVNALVFADRFPFRYMMSDYGLAYDAAFQGCSAETEASFATIVSLANRLDQLKLKYVMVTETSDKSIAETVINSSNDKNQQILVLNSMKMVFPSDVQSGITYLSIMESNLEVLREALS